MDVIFYIFLAVFVSWMLYKTIAPVKGVESLPAEQFQEESEGHKLIDVRESHEYKRGHIPGAVNIPLSQFSQRIEEVPKDQKVFLYCQSGIRSKRAARLLKRNGCTNLVELKGGIMTWKGPMKK